MYTLLQLFYFCPSVVVSAFSHYTCVQAVLLGSYLLADHNEGILDIFCGWYSTSHAVIRSFMFL